MTVQIAPPAGRAVVRTASGAHHLLGSVPDNRKTRGKLT